MGSEKEMLEQFIKDGYQGCPYCGSDMREFDDGEVYSDDVEAMIFVCLNCKREWRELFVRRGIELNDGMEAWEDDIV